VAAEDEISARFLERMCPPPEKRQIAGPAVGVKKLNFGSGHRCIQFRTDTIPGALSASATLREL